jgi:predicted CopG family antitoxin
MSFVSYLRKRTNKLIIMNTKLTLTIEQDIIERAKNYAKDKNRSLSDIIENYLKMLTKADRKQEVTKLNPIVKSLKGSFKMPKDMNYEKELGNRLEEKYL